MTDIQHPAYSEHVQRGHPSRATVGTTDYDIGEEGTLTVEDETDAARVMDRLASTYGVEYDADGNVTGPTGAADGDTDGTGDGSDDTGATDSDADADESDGDLADADPDEVVAETAADDGEALAEAAADADELRDLDMDSLRDLAEGTGVDTDEVDMRSKDEVVAAIMRARSDGVATTDDDADE